MAEMTKVADILSTVSYIAFALSAVCLFVAIFFWFKNKIPSVIGDLSGKTARKSIEKMRESNEKSGNKSFKSSYINAQRGKITETMTSFQKKTSDLEKNTEDIVSKANIPQEDDVPATELLADNNVYEAEIEETALLTEDTELLTDETELLVEETELLAEETELITEETELLAEETDLLTEDEDEGVTAELVLPGAASKQQDKGKKLVMIDDVVEIHTDVSII